MEAQLVREAVPAPVAAEDLPEHLIGIAHEPWALWRSMCLRSAGFPIAQILELASAESAAAAERVLEAEAELEQAQSRALEVLRHDLDLASPDERSVLLDAIVRVKKGKLPRNIGERIEVTTLTAARDRLQAAKDAYAQTFVKSFSPVSHSLQRAAADKRFREALTWQNREALHTGVDRLLAMPITNEPPTSVRRNREKLVANYLQRYCVKNDTIGFFGPIGWATFASAGEALALKHGAQFIGDRRLHFEGWALDAFAAALARDHHLQPWIAPRQFSYVHFDGTTLQMPFERPVKLPSNFAAVLHACDGERTAKQIAAELLTRQ